MGIHRLAPWLCAVTLATLTSACSLPGTSGDEGSTGPGGSNGGEPGGTTTDPRTGPNGTPAGGFVVSGKVSLTGSATMKTLDGVGETESEAKRVTHVVAVTPSSQNTARVVSEVKPTGEFSLDLDPARLWVLVFVDSTKVGSDMIVGVFRTGGLDTLAPLKKGAADLGEVVAKDGVAQAGIAYDALLGALGIEPLAADFLATVDDMCLRVVNPDVDGNGKIDALEKGKDYRLDFHVQFAMHTDHPVSVTDLVGDFLPDTVTIGYGGTGIYTSFPSSSFASGWQTSALSATFDQELHYAPLGGGVSTRVLAAGDAIPTGDLNVSGYGEYGSVGFMAVPGFDMPNGAYRFGFGPSTLTFTNVRTRSDASLAAAESFIMPFIALQKSVAECTDHCALRGFDYVWRKRTDTGWVPATAAEVALVAGERGGFLSIRLENDTAKNIGFEIPATAVSGTIAWSAANSPDDAVRAAATNATIEDICHVGLSYDDKLGMRYFGNIQNAPHTCGEP